jgi:ATP/maltotriose-dependent transcriptional regulator MalT
MAAYITINTQQYKETLTHLETSKMLFEAINEPYYVSWVLHRLGFVHYNLKNNDLASKYTEQSLALARITFNRGAEVICLHNLGTVYTLNGDYLKGRYYCTETLKIANESGHRDQIAYALGLMALVAFVEGDYATARDYAERSEVAVEDNALPGVQPYSLPLMIVLACIQEDYAEGMRLAKSWNIPNANLCDLQCQYWSLSILACGLGNRKDAGLYARQAFEFANLDYALNLWIIPGVIYALTETHPEKAVELFAWVMTCPDTALIWVRQWGLFKRLQLQLQAALDHAVYQSHWQNGTTLSFEAVKLYLQVEFRAQADVETEAEIEAEADTCQQLLTARENEIIRLMAAGMTNPQIAEHLVIGSGTVKTHTLNIYRKLEVANRTQAIIRAQEIGLLTLTLTISS